jgi:hypothetical protein
MIKLAGNFSDMPDRLKEEEIHARKLEVQITRTINSYPEVTKGIAYNALLNAFGRLLLDFSKETSLSELTRDTGQALSVMIEKVIATADATPMTRPWNKPN